MRIIVSSRKGDEPNHSHFCPQKGERILRDGCQGCEFLSKLEAASVSHTVYCKYPEDASLVTFEPSRATDPTDLPAYMGTDPTKIRTHSWAEPKIDGARAILHFTAEGIRVTGRSRNQGGTYTEFSANVPHLEKVRVPEALIGMILDSEIVVLPKGMTASGNVPTGTLGATMSVVASRPALAIETQRKIGWAHFYVFDVVRLSGVDGSTRPFAHRRRILETIFSQWKPEYIHLVTGQELLDADSKTQAFRQALADGYEGLVLKDPTATYGATYSMIKVKERVTYDALITGFDYGSAGSRYQNQIGAVKFSVLSSTGDLVEIGQAVPGSDDLRTRLTRQFETQSDSGASIADLGMVVEVQGQSWTKELRLRHPRILRYRTDKSPDQVSVVDFTHLKRN